MDIRLTLRKGPLEVELEATDDDEYQAEVLDILEFLESHEEQIIEVEAPVEDSDIEPEQASVTADWNQESESAGTEERFDSSSKSSPDRTEHGPTAEFASRLNISPDRLTEIIDIDSELEEPPFIVTDTDGFGDTRQEKQFKGALILLVTWQECYDEDRVPSSDLKDALDFSGIDPNKLSNMYNRVDRADSYFDRSGRGANATVSLTRPGLREARSQIRELAEE